VSGFLPHSAKIARSKSTVPLSVRMPNVQQDTNMLIF